VLGAFKGCKSEPAFVRLAVSTQVEPAKYAEIATVTVNIGQPPVQVFPIESSSSISVSDPKALADALTEGKGVSWSAFRADGTSLGGSLTFKPPSKVGRARMRDGEVALASVTCGST
jgi:hypothetical protein